jgi:HEAT repeat protein
MITMNEVRALLDSEEPNYARAARLGVEVLPHLRVMIETGTVGEASSAAALAGYIHDDRSIDVLRRGIAHASPAVRVAAAGALRSLGRPASSDHVMAHLGDRHAGVRRLAVEAATRVGGPALLAKVEVLGRRDPTPFVRQLAAQASAAPRGGRLA